MQQQDGAENIMLDESNQVKDEYRMSYVWNLKNSTCECIQPSGYRLRH